MSKKKNNSGLGHMAGEDGFVLIAGMMVMVVLTMLGLAATSTTMFEHQISGNDKVAKEVFYRAESAAYEGAQRLENEGDPDNLKASRTQLLWLFGSSTKDKFLEDTSNWNDDELESGITDGEVVASIAAIDKGVVKGEKASTLKMTTPSVYEYQLLGHSKKSTGEKIIEVGYKKRY